MTVTMTPAAERARRGAAEIVESLRREGLLIVGLEHAREAFVARAIVQRALEQMIRELADDLSGLFAAHLLQELGVERALPVVTSMAMAAEAELAPPPAPPLVGHDPDGTAGALGRPTRPGETTA